MQLDDEEPHENGELDHEVSFFLSSMLDAMYDQVHFFINLSSCFLFKKFLLVFPAFFGWWVLV